MHVALRGRCEHAGRAVSEVDRRDCAPAASDVIVVASEIPELIDGVDNARIAEFHLIGHPGIIDFRRLGPQHHVLNPVGRRPTRCSAGTDSDAPRSFPVGNHLIRQCLEFFHRFGNFISGILEVFRHVPNERFHIDLVEEAEEIPVAVRSRI